MPTDGEYRYGPPAPAGPCSTHPGCVVRRCNRLWCDRLIHLLPQRGRPRRFCTPACRIAEYRRLH